MFRLEKTRSDRIFDAVNTVLLGLILIVVLYPLLYVAGASITDPQHIARGTFWLIPKDVTLEGYRRVFQNSDILRGYGNTLFYTFFGTFVNIALTIPAAYALSRKDLDGAGAIAITSSCQYPEAAIRWADLWHRDREHIVNGLYGESWLRGVLGEDWWWTDEEETRFAMAEDPTGELSQSNYRYKYISPAGNGTRIGDTSGIIWDEYFQVLKATQSELNHFPFTVNGYPSTARYTAEEQERLNILQANLDSYVAQMTAKFITGEEKIAEKWDVYVAELKAIGYEELTQIKQAAYDRWNQN